MTIRDRTLRRIELLLFLASFLAYGWFHQGGGWNQNSRFAMTRSIVEQGRFFIDDYLVYVRDQPAGGAALKRLPVVQATYVQDGKTHVLSWDGELPMNVDASPEAEVTMLAFVSSSGDVAYGHDHFHPNKPPGASLLAVPAYWILHVLDGLLGRNPDDWWTLTRNAWLTSAFSVGLISAIGVAIFFRLSLDWAGCRVLPATLATVAFAFGTLYFPYATLMFDHNIVAVALLAAYYALHRARTAPAPAVWHLLAGLCAGLAALTNYLAAIPVFLLAYYILLGLRQWRGLFWYGLGGFGPLLLLCYYNHACFGTPFTTNNHFQDPRFNNPHSLLGMFIMPGPDVPFLLIVSPLRGIFWSSPVLIFGIYGLVKAWQRRRMDCVLFAVIIGFYYLANITFNGWHGGLAFGPRYLVPAVPFLALPLAVPFVERFRPTAIFGALSVAISFLATAVDVQSPVAMGNEAWSSKRWYWEYEPITEYYLPIFVSGRPWPLFPAVLEGALNDLDRTWAAAGESADTRAALREARREWYQKAIDRGEPYPFRFAACDGPVSSCAVGVYEGIPFTLFPAHSREANWNAFNAGEFLFPRSRVSVLPLSLIVGALIARAIRRARQADREAAVGGPSHAEPGPTD